jgi:hypothetical protein
MLLQKASGIETHTYFDCSGVSLARFLSNQYESGYRGTVIQNLVAAYEVQMDDGELLDVEWNSGYDNWTAGDRVMLTTVNGEGYMFNDDEQTQVDVFPWNP